MENIIKKINSKWFLLFLFGMFSVGMQAQYDEGNDLPDWAQEAWDATEAGTNSTWESNDNGGFTEVDRDYEVYETVMDDAEYKDWLSIGGWEDKADHSKEDMDKTINHTDDHHVENIQAVDNNPSWDEMYGDLFGTHDYEPEDNWGDDDQFPPDDTDSGDPQNPDPTPETPKDPDCPTANCPKTHRVKAGTCDCVKKDKTWFRDDDGDGYGYDTEVINQEDKPTKAGEWVEGVSKGVDCDDLKYSLLNICGTIDVCEWLKKLNADKKYSEKLTEIINKAKTDSTKEYGYAIAKGASNYVAGTNDADGNLDFVGVGQIFGYLHDHTLPRATINSSGITGTTEYIQMFSRIDIRTFVNALNNTGTNDVPIADVFSTFVDNAGNVYTLKYEGTYSDIQGKSIDVAALERAYFINFSDDGISRYGGIENAFVAFLEFDVKISGITIYKTTPGTTPTKLGITSDGIKISSSNTPCK